MSFVPPVFSKFGKACSDLLTKQWEPKKDDFKNKVSIKSKSQNLTLTSTITAEDSAASALAGKINAKHECKTYGESSFEIATDGAIKTTSKFSKLKPGLVLSHESNCVVAADKCSGSAKATVEFAAEPAAVSAEFNSKDNSATVSGAVGFEGFSVGVQAIVDVKGVRAEGEKKKDAVSVLGGIQYEDGNVVGTVKVEKGYKFSVSVYHSVSSALQLGGSVVADSTKSADNTFTVGAQYKVSPVVLVKAKADIKGDKSYVVSSFYERRLADPNMVVGVSHQWNGSTRTTSAFGASFALGEN